MKDLISYDDFAKLDIRVGVVVEASTPEWSEKLVRYVMDFGPEIGRRGLFSGIKAWITPEEMVGKKYPVVVNMTPKKMGEEESAGMMIMVDGEERPILIELGAEVEVGEIVR